MIIKGRSRSHGVQLARYLISEKNDRVQVLDIRGTIAAQLTPGGLRNALNEMDAVAGLTAGKKHIFHAVINPNDLEKLGKADWEAAIVKTEEALGLSGQPRVIVRHTYKGKDHLHVAWSRVNTEKLSLISDSFCNLKMVQTAREVEVERGLFRTPDRNKNQRAAALNKILGSERYEVEKDAPTAPFKKQRSGKARTAEVEKLQRERSGKPESEIKRAIASAWHQSETGEEFRAKIESRGYRLVRGRRGAVVMDDQNVIHSPARYVEGLRVPEVNAKCADVLPKLPTEDQARKPFIKPALSPRQAQRVIKQKLKMEFANDMPGDAAHGWPEPF